MLSIASLRACIGRPFLLIATALCINLAAEAQSPTPLQEPSPPVPTGTEIYVTANMPLTAADLTVTIDKKPVQVASVRPAKDDPLLFAILLDLSGSQQKYDHVERAAAWTIFQSLAMNGGRGFLVEFSDAAFATPLLSPNAAQDALTHLKFGGGSAIFDALASTAAQMQRLPGDSRTPRKVIVLLSDGGDNTSRLRADEMEKQIEDAGIVVFAMGIGDLESHARRRLDEVSAVTGGQTELTQNAQNGVDRLLNAIESQMAVRVIPAQAPDQKGHALSVKSGHRNGLSAPATIFLR